MTWRWDPNRGRDGDGAIWQPRWDGWNSSGKGRDGEREKADWGMEAPRVNGRWRSGGIELSGAVERKQRWLRKRGNLFCSRQSAGRLVV